MNQRLVTISYDEKGRQGVFEQLVPLIGDRFQIASYCYNDYVPQPEDNLVLITTLPIKDHVVSRLNSNCKYFVAKRTINPRKLYPLFDIPNDSDVLVVNNFYENSVEVVTELQLIGINHLRFFPYDPAKPLEKKFQYAITPGEMSVVPKSIPNVIELGDRLISLMTIAQIIFYCAGPQGPGDLVDDNFLYTRYIRDLVRLSLENSRQLQQNEILQQQMKMVLSNFEDGIILTETDGKITFHNDMATVILNEKQLIGKYLDETDLQQVCDESFNTSFINISEKVIHVTRREVSLNNTKMIQMLTLKDLTNIKTIDEQYKRQKKYTEYTAKYTFGDIIYKSSAMSKVINIAKRLAQSESTLLITGESGTGKELIAQSIHNASARKEFPFVAINCAALSESLLESELFGYEDGAFTGARKGGKKGIFELADGGTIFLDEIGDAPLAIQTKLLRVLQEKEIMRISGSKIIPIDVRVIAATNKDLLRLSEKGVFRQDLYYRLHVLSLYIPPLRNRREDIEILLCYLMHKHGATAITSDIQKLLAPFSTYLWPGNIRELENIAEYIATIHDASTDLREDILKFMSHSFPNEPEHDSSDDPLGNLLFRNPKMKEELTCILQLLHEAKAKQLLIGRFRLSMLLQEKKITLTPQQVKMRLDILRNAGFIITSNGKGSILTAAGEQYLYSHS
jgi:Transcriptional regulator containing PAS, AAA-type ATPase, and DNA-binding domains